jgi:hypothetical protein
MQNEKKELLKKFKTVIDCLMIYYEECTDEETARDRTWFIEFKRLFRRS